MTIIVTMINIFVIIITTITIIVIDNSTMQQT